MATLGKITPKKVPASQARRAEEDITETGPRGVMAFFIAFGIILAALIGFYAYKEYQADTAREENQYNGFDFAQAEGGLWVTRIEIGQQPYDIPFYYHPRDTELIPVDKRAVDPLFKAPRQVYITVDPDAGAKVVVAGVEISRITGSKYNLLNLETHGALTRPPGGKADVPVISCQNATDDLVVIQFVEGKQNLIARSDYNPNCIILQYTDINESVRVADRYAYMLLRIM